MKYVVVIGDGMADYPLEELRVKHLYKQPKSPIWIT